MKMDEDGDRRRSLFIADFRSTMESKDRKFSSSWGLTRVGIIMKCLKFQLVMIFMQNYAFVITVLLILYDKFSLFLSFCSYHLCNG